MTKSPGSNSKKKEKQPKNDAKRNNSSSPGTRAAKVQHDSKVETPITLPAATSAIAASLSLLAGGDTGGDTGTSVHASSKTDPVVRHTQDTTTPIKSLDKDMHDKIGPGLKEPGVTFTEIGSDRGAPSVKSEPAITSIISDPLRPSRRTKARDKSNGRTSESFTRADQAFIRWENFIYDSLFVDRPSGDPTAIVGFTLASGRHIKIGETLDKSLIDTHIKQLRADLTFGQKEAILNQYLKPPDKSKRTNDVVLPHQSRRRSLRLREDADNDDRSVSTIGTTNSNLSKRSDEVSQHSGKFKTMDPDNRDEPMQSPIRLEEGRFIHRREHINSAQHTNMRPVVTTPDFFRQEASATDLAEVTLIDKRRPFVHTASNPYPFEEVSWRAFRVMMCDCVAHWRDGPRLEDIILWACWTAAFRKDFL